MLRAAVLFALVSAAAVAAPAPPPTEKELIARHWGKAEGSGEFAAKGKQLTLRAGVPPTRGVFHRDRMTMPRVTRTLAGDFEVTVRVPDATAPNKDAKHEDAYPGTRAGLYVSGGGYGIEFHLYQYHPKVNGAPAEELKRVVWLDTWFPGGGVGVTLKPAEAGKSVYLRVTRKGKSVTVSYSFDGKEWSTPQAPRREIEFPEEVEVGVFLRHSTYQVVGATFDGLTIEKLNKKPE